MVASVAISFFASACTQTIPFGGHFEPSIYAISENRPQENKVIPVEQSSPTTDGLLRTSARPAAQEPLPEVPVRESSETKLVERAIGSRRAQAGTDGMVWPILGEIVGSFRSVRRPGHQGLDLAARPGTSVVVAQAGRVLRVGEIQGYGTVVVVEHDEATTTLYAQLTDDRVVTVGESVSIGSAIGKIGSRGYLHFEVRRGDHRVDPALLFDTAPAPEAEETSVKIEEPSGRVSFDEAEVVVAARSVEVASTVAQQPPPALAVPAEPSPSVIETLPPESSQEPRVRIEGNDDMGDFKRGATLFAANLAFVPVKLGYAAAGSVVGTFAFALTGGAVTDVWEESLGGDFILTPEHLSGEQPIRFRGTASSE